MSTSAKLKLYIDLQPLRSLQELSYALCHVYASATSSVSIPTPVYCKHYRYLHFSHVPDDSVDADVCASLKLRPPIPLTSGTFAESLYARGSVSLQPA